MHELPFPVRGGLPKDVSYILSSWKRSYAASPPQRWVTDNYFGRMNQACADIMQAAQAIVVTDPDDDGYILAWAVFSEDTLHYCFTKSMYRKMGLMRHVLSLHLPASVVYYSHATEDGGPLAASLGLTYKPSAAFPRDSKLYWKEPRGRDNDEGNIYSVSKPAHVARKDGDGDQRKGQPSGD
jgi:hypothetical protein